MALTKSDFEIVVKHMKREREDVLRRLGILAAEGKASSVRGSIVCVNTRRSRS